MTPHLLRLLLCLTPIVAPAPAQTNIGCDVFVTEEGPVGNVLAFHGNTGLPDGLFATVPPTPPAFLQAIHTGVPGQHVLVGAVQGGVREFDRNTGALIKIYNPTGGYQWAGLYAPDGTVLIGDQATDDVRRYDPVTGAPLVPPVFGLVPDPADMLFGPNGNLFVCSFPGGVFELNGATGAFVAHHVPSLNRPNDLVFLPDGRRIVTSMTTNLAHVFDASWNQITTFAGTGWGRPHGIAQSPHDGHIYVVDGITNAVHRFDPTTYAETHQAWILIESKPVDVEFRIPQQVCGTVLQFGPGCGGLTIGYTGAPDIGALSILRLAGGRPGLPAVLALGESNVQWNGVPLPFSLTPFGAPGCSVLVSQAVTLGTAMGGQGTAQIPLPVPPDRGLIGASLFAQWIAVDPGTALGVSTSNGAEVRLGG